MSECEHKNTLKRAISFDLSIEECVDCGASRGEFVIRSARCQHKTRHAPSSYNKHALHTLQCDLDEHTDSRHVHKLNDSREVIWFREGPPPDVDYSTRFRFFKDH